MATGDTTATGDTMAIGEAMTTGEAIITGEVMAMGEAEVQTVQTTLIMVESSLCYFCCHFIARSSLVLSYISWLNYGHRICLL